MLIARSPLRITLGGGGTDLPSYYEQHTGFLIAAAIDKYIYITLHQAFTRELIIKYSKLERVEHVDQIEHPIVRESLKLVLGQPTGLEITSMADIPAGFAPWWRRRWVAHRGAAALWAWPRRAWPPHAARLHGALRWSA